MIKRDKSAKFHTETCTITGPWNVRPSLQVWARLARSDCLISLLLFSVVILLWAQMRCGRKRLADTSAALITCTYVLMPTWISAMRWNIAKRLARNINVVRAAVEYIMQVQRWKMPCVINWGCHKLATGILAVFPQSKQRNMKNGVMACSKI